MKVLILFILSVVVCQDEMDGMCGNLTTSCINNCFCELRNVQLSDEERVNRDAINTCRDTLCTADDSCPTIINLDQDLVQSRPPCTAFEQVCRRRNVISTDGNVVRLLARTIVTENRCVGLSRRCEGSDCNPNYRCQSAFETLLLPGIEITTGTCGFFEIPRCVGCVCALNFSPQMPVMPPMETNSTRR